MDQIEYHPQTASDDPARQTTSLFLALYLLILAFFIVLVTISSLEEVKSKAVMDSLSSTFASVMPPTMDPAEFLADEGNILAGEAFLEVVADIFATGIQVTRVEEVQPGSLMQVVMPSESLFFSGSIRIRDAHMELIDRIVAALSAAEPGLSHEMEFLIGIPGTAGGGFPVGETLEKGRAGVFARTMRAHGAPPHSVIVGLRPGREDEVVMRFFVRAEGDGDLPVDPAAARNAGTEGAT